MKWYSPLLVTFMVGIILKSTGEILNSLKRGRETYSRTANFNGEGDSRNRNSNT